MVAKWMLRPLIVAQILKHIGHLNPSSVRFRFRSGLFGQVFLQCESSLSFLVVLYGQYLHLKFLGTGCFFLSGLIYGIVSRFLPIFKSVLSNHLILNVKLL